MLTCQVSQVNGCREFAVTDGSKSTLNKETETDDGKYADGGIDDKAV